MDSIEVAQYIGFYKAFASITRLMGKCNLIVMWKSKGRKRQFIAHSFNLSYNHEGVKTYRVVLIEQREIKKLCGTEEEYVEISMREAASLLQDAYGQNIRFNTSPAAGFTSEYILLAQDTSNQERLNIIEKLSQQELTTKMFTNIYFAALRRMDNGLLYDLSSENRRTVLGDRNEFLFNGGKEYQGYTYLRNSIISIKRVDDYYNADVFTVLITEQEKIVKITYNLIIAKQGKEFFIDAFRETDREILDNKHPDNPFNYLVYCSRYKLLSANKVSKWLDNEYDVLLTGELKDCHIYKWLQSNDNPADEFNINDKILGEYVLTNDELIIFAKKPYNLIKAERKAAECSLGVKLQKKYVLPIQQLYQYIFMNCSDGEDNLNRSSCLHEFCGQSALIYLGDNYSLIEYLNYISEGKNRLGLRGWYFYGKSKEYYLSKGWLIIYVYGETIEKEIERLEKQFGVKEKVLNTELESQYDLLNRPISEQKKWHIYGLLQRFYQEKNDLQDLGLVTPLEEVLRTFGAVKTG